MEGLVDVKVMREEPRHYVIPSILPTEGSNWRCKTNASWKFDSYFLGITNVSLEDVLVFSGCNVEISLFYTQNWKRSFRLWSILPESLSKWNAQTLWIFFSSPSDLQTFSTCLSNLKYVIYCKWAFLEWVGGMPWTCQVSIESHGLN